MARKSSSTPTRWFGGWKPAKKLSRSARSILETPEISVYVSAASDLGAAINVELGKFKPSFQMNGFSRQVEEQRFKHALRAGSLGGSHRDPFDRRSMAQAQIENLSILSSDKLLDEL
jgi:PIN domain nuclease of toxin-antitoxin system